MKHILAAENNQENIKEDNMLYSQFFQDIHDLLSINKNALRFCNAISCFDLVKPFEIVKLPGQPFTFNSVKKIIKTPAPYRAILLMKSNRPMEKDLMAVTFDSSSARFNTEIENGSPYYNNQIDYFYRRIDFEECRKNNASPVFVLIQAEAFCQAAPAPDHGKLRNYTDLFTERLRKVDEQHFARLDYNGQIIEIDSYKRNYYHNCFEYHAKKIIGPSSIDKSGYISFYNVAARLREAEILRQRRAAAAAAELDTTARERVILSKIENARQVVADYVISYDGSISPYTAGDVTRKLFHAVSGYKSFQARKSCPDGYRNIKAKTDALDDIEEYIQAVYDLISAPTAATA